ncbi:thioesterase domain-containing protein [Burkholderia gladioli]|uniref:thioesterase domain-containing protein n=1 Tax=Burkholderia gladioli TaxID=28095 RepID=UPI001640BBBF|nr:thioesterase domain-containing protein [Burkholderia gladioli]
MTSPELERNCRAYAGLATLLDAAGLAEHACYLNWGYAPVASAPDWAAQRLPEGELGAHQARLILEALGELPLDGRTVLDVGCGRGGALALMARLHRPRALFGADLSDANIDYCRRRHPDPRLRFQIADACRLPHPSGSIDLVFNLESSGAYPDLPAFFRHVHRVLRDGGHFCYTDVLDRDSVALIRGGLGKAGFTLLRERSINAQVLAARRAASPGIWQRLDAALTRLGDGALRRELERYLATPDSAMFAALDQGEVDYHVFHWTRTGPWREPFDAASRTRLEARTARLEAALSGEPAGPASSAARPAERATAIDRRPGEQPASAWFPLLQPSREAAFNLFALPYAGGGASVYRQWSLARQADREERQAPRLCALQPPGRESRIAEAAPTRMAELVEQLAAVLHSHTDRPWGLLGCSLGCKVAFELARYFEALGRAPQLLFLMACPAPSLPLNRPISSYDDAAFHAEVQRLGGTPQEILADPEMMRAVIPALRADSELAEHYVCPGSARIDAPITMIAASDDHLVTLEQTRRWERHTRGRFDWQMVDGGHFFLRRQRGDLLRRLQQALDSCASSLPS